MSVPFVFSPVQVRGQYYSDGGVGYWLPIDPLYTHGIRNMIAVGVHQGGHNVQSTALSGCEHHPDQASEDLGTFSPGHGSASRSQR